MSEEKQTFDLATINPISLKELEGFKEKQLEIVKENPFISITDHASYEEGKKRRTALVKARTSLQSQEKVIASKLKELRTKAGIVINDELISVTLPHEEKQQEEVRKYEAKKEAEKARKEEEERQRILEIKRMLSASEEELQKAIREMTFSNIDETHKLIKNIYDRQSELDFEEFSEMHNEIFARIKELLFSSEDNLRKEENQRLENERLKKEAEEANRKSELQSKRIEELLPYTKYFDVSIAPTLGDMSEEDFLKIWNSALDQKSEQDRLDNIDRLEKEKRDKEQFEHEKKIEADKQKIADEKEEIRKKEESENKMKLRIDRITDELGLVFNYSDAFVGKDGTEMSVKDVKSYSDEDFGNWIEVIKERREEEKQKETPDYIKQSEAYQEVINEETSFGVDIAHGKDVSIPNDIEVNDVEEVDFEPNDEEMETFLISLTKAYYSQGDNYYAGRNKKGNWTFGYSNDKPMQHGSGQEFTWPEKMVSILTEKFTSC